MELIFRKDWLIVIKYLSLFSGIGAFEKAMTNLKIPYELVGFSEIDKYASKSYCAIHNVDESLNYGDITKIDEKQLPKVDFITYGFPCQDISLAGKRKGFFDEDGNKTRSGLFFDAVRIIKETQPKVAIAENVKNLVSKSFKERFQIVLEALDDAGYNNYYKVLKASDFGVPQERERIFIVSIRKDVDSGIFEFPEPYELKTFFKDILEENPDSSYNMSDVAIATLNKYKPKKPIKLDVAPTLTCELAHLHGKNLYPKICCMFEHLGMRPRHLTLKEGFRLMGFEDKDVEACISAKVSKTQIYKQTGNSIVVDVAEELLCMLFDEEGNFFI